MKDNFQVPVLGTAPRTYDASFYNRMLRNIEMVLNTVRSLGPVAVTTATLKPVTVAALPTEGRVVGMLAYASNGRKNGEGAGSGTGVMVFYDGTDWIACDSGQAVSD